MVDTLHEILLHLVATFRDKEMLPAMGSIFNESHLHSVVSHSGPPPSLSSQSLAGKTSITPTSNLGNELELEITTHLVFPLFSQSSKCVSFGVLMKACENVYSINYIHD